MASTINWLGRVDRILLAISLVTSTAYWALHALRPYPGSVLLKWIPIAILALLGLMNIESAQGLLLALALLAHSAGDVLLGLEKPKLFVPAIVGFLIGHVLYILTFRLDLPQEWHVSAARWVLVVGVLVYAAGMSVVLLPRMPGHLIVPVIVYIIAITAMAITGVLAEYRTQWIALGAICYVISDSIIAINLFVHPFAWSGYVSWPLYYIAQAFITLGILYEMIVTRG